MMHSLVRSSAVLLLALLTGCSGTPQATSEAVPGDGGVPDFYTWAGELPSRPGQLLRSEPLTPQQGLKSAALNIRILYTSTDGRSNGPIAVSGALFIPEGTPPKGGWPLMA